MMNNFSRPVRSLVSVSPKHVPPPLVPPSQVDLEAHKRLVLERNAARAQPHPNAHQRPGPSPITSQSSSSSHVSSSSSLTAKAYGDTLGPSSPAVHAAGAGLTPKAAQRAPSPNASSSATSMRSQSQRSIRSPSANSLSPPSPLRSVASSPNLNTLTASSYPSPAKGPQTVVLPRDPPKITVSPTSLYSRYSYYQLDSPSPTTDPSRSPSSPNVPPPHPDSRMPSPSPQNIQQNGQLSTTPKTASDYLQLGIQHHEANRLKESAACFERSAREGGGCGVGKLMWGLTLRHGWGCERN
ncbi:hypothetical protein HGRIS_001421 [Hohenbuehelia grisea]|uniref:Uncharacterized protein n=1 Tax=Hohenbuehelia grisea TaxID=104357 RepID=A0ABR3JPV3_9AGAR